jgi:hypothetical protein
MSTDTARIAAVLCPQVDPCVLCQRTAEKLVEAGVGFVAQAKAEERERIAQAILLACCHFDRYKGNPEWCGYCESAADAARAAREDGAK